MKIAINCVFFQPKGGGIKEYIYNLVNNIYLIDKKNEYILYVLQDQLAYAKQHFPGKLKIKTIPFVSGKLRHVITRSLLEQRFWEKEEWHEKFDIFHSPFFHSPSFKYAKVILTVHDLRFYRFPATYTFLRYLYLKFTVKRSVKKADHIISISNFTKKELLEAYGILSKKVTIIHEAINQNRFKETNKILPENNLMKKLREEGFILSVGHIEPRKNYIRLIKAFRLLKKREEWRNLNLVIVGKKGHNYKPVLNLVDSVNGIHYLNFVEHEFLIWLYKNAKIFVFPSFYEGFGFPPLEAACMDCVSAVSNISSIPEICGEGVFYFDPFNIEAMEQCIHHALSDELARENVLNKMKINIERFSWKQNAEETINLYNTIGSISK